MRYKQFKNWALLVIKKLAEHDLQLATIASGHEDRIQELERKVKENEKSS